jgi:hypothetical protein
MCDNLLWVSYLHDIKFSCSLHKITKRSCGT